MREQRARYEETNLHHVIQLLVLRVTLVESETLHELGLRLALSKSSYLGCHHAPVSQAFAPNEWRNAIPESEDKLILCRIGKGILQRIRCRTVCHACHNRVIAVGGKKRHACRGVG